MSTYHNHVPHHDHTDNRGQHHQPGLMQRRGGTMAVHDGRWKRKTTVEVGWADV
jgi:hypothetical protein